MNDYQYTYEQIRENDRIPAHFRLAVTPTYTIPAHWHKYLEILYLISGKMTAVVQAATYTLSAGGILIINSGDIHMTQTHGERTEYILLQISDQRLLAFFPDFHLLRFATWIPCTDTQPGSVSARQHLLEMLSVYQQKEDGYPLLFTARLYELLHCLYCCHSVWMTPSAHSPEYRNLHRITRIIDWIQNHYQDPLSLNEAASHLGLTREYFCRIFRKYTGQTFLEYVANLRVMNFYQELITTDESITRLMEKHGITNYKVFLQTFRKLYGDTPQRLRSRGIRSADTKWKGQFAPEKSAFANQSDSADSPGDGQL